MSEELKPCPFCGGEAEIMGDQYPYVECQKCAVSFTHDHSYDADFDDAASKWNSRKGVVPKMTRIAESKVHQLGGDICGVLVRKEDGAIMAVSEDGRCTRLDGEVMGPAAVTLNEPMSEDFKAAWQNGIPLQSPEAKWAFVGWQAARAQGGRGAEPVASGEPLPCPFCGETPAWVKKDDPTWPQVECQNIECPISHNDWISLEAWNTRTYTHPPAKPESVPEGWKLLPVHATTDMVRRGKRAHDEEFLFHEDPDSNIQGIWKAMLAIAPEPPTTPQPQADGWVKCAERLPTEADEDICGQVWGWVETKGIGKWFRMSATETRDMSGNRAGPICTLWMPTGLKRPQPPKQEGEGDE